MYVIGEKRERRSAKEQEEGWAMMVIMEEKGRLIVMEGKDCGWSRTELLPGTRPLYLLLDQREAGFQGGADKSKICGAVFGPLPAGMRNASIVKYRKQMTGLAMINKRKMTQCI